MDFNTGGPAFPTVAGQGVYSNGMTLRDWFAGQALAWAGHDGWLTRDHENMAKRAYRMADAMIAARSAQ